MDRSFLSDAAVIASSRKFVCIRLATYESESEAKILKSIFLGRSGDLENTSMPVELYQRMPQLPSMNPSFQKIPRIGRKGIARNAVHDPAWIIKGRACPNAPG